MIELGEKGLGITEDLFKSIYNDSPIGIELYDSNGKLIDLNQSCMELFGVSIKDDVKGFDILNDPNIPNKHLTKLKQRETIRYESTFDFDLVKKHKLYETTKLGKIYIDVLITPLFLKESKSISNYLVQVQDISDRKIAERKCVALNEELESRILEKTKLLNRTDVNWRVLVEEAPDIILTVDQNGDILYVNKVSNVKTREEAIGTNVLEYISADYHEIAKNSIEDVFQTGESGYYEASARGPNNTILWYSTRLGAIKKGEKVTSVMLLARDITERKNMEQILEESEEKFRSITEQSLMGIAILHDDRFSYVNKQIADIFEYSPEEMKNWERFEYVKLIHPDDQEMALEQAKKKQLGLPDAVIHYQFRGITKKGKVKWLEIYSNSINYRDEIADLITIIDISDKREVEQKLLVSEEKYRMLIDNIVDIIFEIDLDGKITYLSSQSFNMLGYKPEEIINQNAFRFIHPDDQEKVLKNQNYVINTGEVGAVEFRVRHKKDHYIKVSSRGQLIEIANQKKIVGLFRNITESKKIEGKLQEEKERAEMYLNLVNVIIVALDQNGNISMINKKGNDILGWNEGDLIGKNWFENCLPPEDGEKVHDYFKKLMKDEMKVIPFYENPIMTKNGDEKLIAWSTILFKDTDGKITGLLSSGEDITERKKTENNLQESKQLLETTLYNLQDAIFILDDKIPPKVIECNPASEEIFGYSRDEIIGNTTAFLHVDEDSLKEFQEAILPKLHQDGNFLNFKFKMKRKNGNIFPTEHAISGLRNENGDTLGVVSLVRDITERKEAERTLLRKNLEIQAIFNTIPAMLNVVDREYNVIDISDAFAEEFHNGNKENAIGKKCYQTHKQRDTICPDCSVRRVFESGNIETKVSLPEEEMRTGKALKIYAAPIKDVDGNVTGAVEAIMDITDIIKAEQKIRDSEKKLIDLIESVPIGISITSPEGNIIECNSNAFQIFGYNSKEDFMETSVMDLYYIPNDRNKLLQLHEKGMVKDFEVQFKRKDGSIFWGSLNSITHKIGSQTTFINSFQDITERKKTEIKIQQSEAELSAIYNYTPIAILLLDNERRIRKINKFALKFTDRREEDVFGILGGEALRCLYSIEDPRGCGFSEHCQKCVIRNTVLDTFKSKSPHINVEATLFLLPGSVADRVHLLFSTIPLKLDGEDRVLVSMIDITERIKAKQELKESEERFKYLVSSSPSIIYTSKTSGDYGATFISDNVEEMWGYQPEMFINNSEFWLNHIHPDDKEYVLKMLSDLYEKDHNIYEYRFKRIDDTYHWMRDEVMLVRDELGNAVETIGSVIDITERVEAEKELKESESRYRDFFENSPIGLMEQDFSELKKYVESLRELGIDDFEKFFDDNPEEILKCISRVKLIDVNRKILEVYKANNKEEFICKMNQLDKSSDQMTDEIFLDNKEEILSLIKGETMYESEIVSKSLTGDTIYIYAKTLIIPGFENTWSKVIVSIVDITNRRIAEQKLKKSEEKYRKLSNQYEMLLESITDAVYALNRDWEYIIVNKNAEDIVNMPIEKLIGHKIFEVFPGIEHTPFFKTYEKTMNMRSAERIINSFTLPDGHMGYYEVSVYPIKEGIFCIGKDVTEEKQIEQKLKESEEKFRTITEQSLIAICIAQDNKIKYINQVYADIFGYTIEEMMNWELKDAVNAIHPEDREFALEQLAKKQRGDKDIINHYQYRGINKSGEIVWVENFSKSIDYDGKPADFITLIDITEKKEAEQKLKESEEKFRNIAQQTSLGLMIQQEGLIRFANSAIANISEYSMQEINNWSVEDMKRIIYKEDQPFINAKINIIQRDDFDTSEQFECRIITKSGSTKWLEFIGKPIIYLGKKAVFASLIDITAKKKLEEELIEISRLKSELLSRTSHELKTPLVSIKGYADILLSQHYEMLDIYTVSVLNEIKQGCYRLESLIKDLLETSKLESGEIKLNKIEDDLAFLIRFCIRDLKGLIERRNHELILDIQDIMMTLFEKERIYEVIINLLSNAIKYTPSNGQISIKSEIKDNNYIISVKDNGIGVSKDEKEKIFKKFGKVERYGKGMDVVSEGSGLGLYISKKIIELHGGEIWVESEGRDKGTTFYFSLPIIKK